MSDPILDTIVNVAASLTGARVLLLILSSTVDASVKASPDTKDDTIWDKVRTSFPYLFVSNLLENLAGAGLPGAKKRE